MPFHLRIRSAKGNLVSGRSGCACRCDSVRHSLSYGTLDQWVLRSRGFDVGVKYRKSSWHSHTATSRTPRTWCPNVKQALALCTW